MSDAVTIHAFDFDNFNHSTQISFFSKTKSFKFNIISMILSFIQGSVEYSWFTHFTFIQVTLVQGIEERRTLLREFQRVTQ
jgi:hypothetical protein